METKQLGHTRLSSHCVRAQKKSGEGKKPTTLPVSRVLIKLPVCEQLVALPED